VGLEEKKQLVFNPFLFVSFHKKSMFAELNSDINSFKSSLLHLTGQPYWKKNRSAKVKDGIITYFLGTVSLVDT
jgi:hypothetical protein